MRHVRAGEAQAMPWRNGGGVTREYARDPEEGEALWRISLADVAADGPFSAFQGIDRTLAVIAGGGIELVVEGRAARLEPCAPFSFPGDAAVQARLPAGPIRGLNVMTRRGVVAHRVRLMEPGIARAFAPGEGETFAIFALDPLACRAAGEDGLAPHDLLMIGAGEILDLPARGGRCLFIELARLA